MTNKRGFIQLAAALLCLLILAFSPLRAVKGQKGQLPTQEKGVPEGYVIVEGDIQMPVNAYRALVNARHSPDAAFLPQTTNLWPDGIVPYNFDITVSAANKAVMITAMATLEVVANVHFRQCFNNACSGDYVHVNADPQSNNSAVGRQGNGQIINIASWDSRFRIVHELLHCLGLFHEQSRRNRDDFVRINTDNVQAGRAHNFDLQLSSSDYGPYDFDSVMHYDQCAFSSGCGTDPDGNPIQTCSSCPGKETIIVYVPNNTQWQTAIGQRDHLSYLDRVGLSFLYPQSNWRFVDQAYNGVNGASDGSFRRPYLTFAAGIANTPMGGTLWIQPGDYAAAGVYNNGVTLQAPLGGVALR